MGGIAWVLTRLPGKRAERVARMARHTVASREPGELRLRA